LITYNLNKEGFETVAAHSGPEAWQLIQKEHPDLIILDLMLPGQDGLEICRELRRADNLTPIIMLTARDDEIDRVLGLELGADDYVTKPFSVRELTARVKAVLRRRRATGETESDEAWITVGSFVIKPERYEIYQDGQRLELTLKEYELLELLLRNQGRVLKRDYLLQVLWDYNDSVSTRVLDVQISKLREKIEADSHNPHYIKTVRGLGYKFEVPADV
ncbi:MAG: response regulator transcription factor, partial [Syntrophomonas sp.]|nr:response regulator transcription factor [Syntrophomonas sp.]